MRRIRISIFMIVITLLCSGIVMVYSSSATLSFERYQFTTFFLRHHLFHFIIGTSCSALVMSLNLNLIRRWARPLFFISIITLMLVYLPNLGKEVGGAKRWLRVGLFSFQPSELAKWATVLFLADILANRKKKITSFLRHFLLPLISVGVVCALILIQPDLGSAVALATVALIMFFVAGINLSYLLSLILLSIPILYFSIFNVPYRRRRTMAFLNPWDDPQGFGFQIVQSYLALGLGGLWGVGLGQSKQKLFYLPAAQTDFIFSIVGEELGLIGTVSIVVLFVLFLWQGIKISLRSTDPFIQILSFGIVLTIVLTACVHIAVVCGAMPTKGLPLPFISYGGSSLVFNMTAVGLLLNAARDRYFQQENCLRQ